MYLKSLRFPDNQLTLSGSTVIFCNLAMSDINIPADWLSETESIRFHSISNPQQAHFYRLSRGILRAVLGHFISEQPEKVTFAVQPHGKLQLTGNQLQFNISHSQHWLAIAVSGSPVGIDIEYSDDHTRQRSWLAVAKRFFTDDEYLYLKAQPATNVRAVFTRFWTQKEAILKAHGAGLNAGLHKLNLLSLQHSLDQQTYWLEYGEPVPQLQCAISTQNSSKEPVTYYILNERLEIHPLQPPYISHLCLKPDSL